MVNPSETKNSFSSSQDYIIQQNQVSHSFKYDLYRKMFFKLTFVISELKWSISSNLTYLSPTGD